MASIWINDGYTLDGVIPGRVGLYPETPFVYRPALAEHVHAYLMADRSTPPKRLAADLKFLAEHLVSVGDHGGPLQPDELRRVHHSALTAMVNAVTGYTEQLADGQKN